MTGRPVTRGPARGSHLRQVSTGSTTEAPKLESSSREDDNQDPAETTHQWANLPRNLERRICTISIHDEAFSHEDVVVNVDAFPLGTVRELDLGSISVLESQTISHDFQDDIVRPPNRREHAKHTRNKTRPTSAQRDYHSELGYEAEDSQKFLFIIKNATAQQKTKHPKLEISVTSHVATAFGFKNRSRILFSVEDKSKYAASHVEVAFKDEYMTRADMWRFTMSELCQRTIFKGQKLLFMGTMKAVVKNIYIQGHKVQSALFDGLTKPIFRSESARYVLFIQMSKEMWDFDSDGSGEIMFDKVISGFLPELFKRWTVMGVKHLVSIVLFTRVEYDASLPIAFKPELGFHGVDAEGKMTGDRPPYKDFYRVVVNEMASGEWATILYQLKKEFLSFHRDVSTQTIPLRERPREETALSLVQEDAEAWIPRVTGGPSAAIHGNILEAINLASSNFATDYVDRDLVRTGISIVIITPGTALFEVNQEILRQTTDIIIANGIGLDIVSLARMPLHSVPLFKYRDLDTLSAGVRRTSGLTAVDDARKQAALFSRQTVQEADLSESQHTALALAIDATVPNPTFQHEWSYAVPNWIDVSFWLGSSAAPLLSQDHQSPSQPSRSRRKGSTEMVLRCKMYELQMMGVTSNDSVSISLPYLHESYLHPPLDTRPLGGRGSLPSESPLVGSSSGTSTPTGHKGLNQGLLLGVAKPESSFPRRNREMFRWMDSYDNTVFENVSLQRRRQLEALQRRSEAEKRRTTHQKVDGASLLGTSYNMRDQSLDESDATPGMAYFDRKMKERKSLAKAAERKSSFSSSHSATSNSLSKSAKSARHISFNLRGFSFTPPKAIASTQVKPATGEISSEPMPIKNSKNRTVVKRDSPIKNSFSESGHSINSQNEDTARLLSKSSNEPFSQPISISKTTDAVELTRSYHNRIANTSIYNGALKDQKESEKLDVLQAASRSKHAGPKLDPMSGVTETPTALSPQKAMAPWLTVLNPFNPKKNDKDLGSQFRRWQHVYPKPLQATSIKWKSLCSPAAIPITTECFPNAKQLATEYTESPYNIDRNDENNGLNDVSKPREQLLKELIYLRLTQGFQIVVGPAVVDSLGHRASKLVTTLDPEQLQTEGAVIVLSMGNSIHQIVCTEGGELEVKIMVRKPPRPLSSIDDRSSVIASYRPAIRTTLADSYQLREMNFQNPRADYNWNFADLLVAGYEDELVNHLRYWRARFVLIPVDLAPGARRPANSANEDNDEEIRLEGIRKLTQMWQRHKFIPPEERNFQTSRKNQKDLNPLNVEFQTRDPSAIIAAELEGLSSLTVDAAGRRSHLFTDLETFQRSNFSLATIAQEMQGVKGVKLQDRRWHWRLHWNCFIGHEFTTWLLERFQDVETRDAAVDLGNDLMRRGLFKHVEGRHQFRDGNYFYHITNEYSAARAESRGSWLGALRPDRSSVPSTPISDSARETSSGERLSQSNAFNEKLLGPDRILSPASEAKKRKFALSKVIQYDVDPRKRSDRPELINLHYDLLHNPDSCYHIRLDWLNVTPKLIEDAIVSWATNVEKFGLKFVQVPINEVSKVSMTNPFKEPYPISLAIQPPPQLPPSLFEATSLVPRARPTKEFYQSAILKKFGFVLDFEAARNFPREANVAYSWGKPDYEFSQFIHHSGVLLAQIKDDGTLILLANQKLNNRTPREQNRHIHQEQHERRHISGISQMLNHGPGNISGSDRPSPYASPLLRAAPDVLGWGFAGANMATTLASPEQIKNDLEAFCGDGEKLEEFFNRLLRLPPSPAPPSALLEQNIPTLGLPPTASRSPSPAINGEEKTEA